MSMNKSGLVVKKRTNGSRSVSRQCDKISLTHQSMKDECDVYKIMDKHKRTGIMKVNKGYEKPLYGDFSSSIDYQEACNLVISAESQFMSLPSAIRKKFNNDPSEFLDFVENEDNKEDMIKMGLLKDDSDLLDSTGSSQNDLDSSSNSEAGTAENEASGAE